MTRGWRHVNFIQPCYVKPFDAAWSLEVLTKSLVYITVYIWKVLTAFTIRAMIHFCHECCARCRDYHGNEQWSQSNRTRNKSGDQQRVLRLKININAINVPIRTYRLPFFHNLQPFKQEAKTIYHPLFNKQQSDWCKFISPGSVRSFYGLFGTSVTVP